MKPDDTLNDYLVLSRGQWDAARSTAEIQAAIDAFYVWYEKLVAEGRFRRGSRLTTEGRVVTRQRIADGPFAEAKELVGGYWIVRAASLDEAAELMAHNPTVACGLAMELRPLDAQRARADVPSNETPRAARR